MTGNAGTEPGDLEIVLVKEDPAGSVLTPLEGALNPEGCNALKGGDLIELCCC